MNFYCILNSALKQEVSDWILEEECVKLLLDTYTERAKVNGSRDREWAFNAEKLTEVLKCSFLE